jgi:hypothetical protein
MNRVGGVGRSAALLALSFSCASLFGLFTLEPAAAQSLGDNVIHLDQAWPQTDRDWYYHFSQGSAVIPYDIFLNLELADSQELFRSDANSERYGLITDAANPQSNPDGLPIGLSKSVIADPPRWKGEETGEFVGLNCAACHEGQLNYKGKHIRIEGGVGNMFDLMGYVYALDDAMQETLKEAAKFDRLAARLGANPDTKGKLRARFESEAAKVHEYRTRTLVTPPELGPLTS